MEKIDLKWFITTAVAFFALLLTMLIFMMTRPTPLSKADLENSTKRYDPVFRRKF